jgi:hypothetical protein
MLEYSPAVQGVGGSRFDRDMFASGTLVKDGDDFGQDTPYIGPDVMLTHTCFALNQ